MDSIVVDPFLAIVANESDHITLLDGKRWNDKDISRSVVREKNSRHPFRKNFFRRQNSGGNSLTNILIKIGAQHRGIASDAARRAGFRGTKESIKKSLAVVGIAERIKRKFFPPEVLPFSSRYLQDSHSTH